MSYKGSGWEKQDLHVHTYLDPNWIWPPGYPGGRIKQQERIDKFEQDLIQHCVKNGIRVIAITDHNTGEAIDALLRRNRSLGAEITIFPGVEVKSTEGTHILVIFNPDKSVDKKRWDSWKETIDHFLTSIFTDKPRYEQVEGRNTPANAPLPVDEIIKKSQEFSAITIFPHVLSSGGIFKCNSGTRKRALKLCNILDLACGDDEVEKKRKSAAQKLRGQEFNPQNFALIRSSDARKIADVGSRLTWIKSDPTFEGLKQIIYEPELRVHLGRNPPRYLYPQITSVQLKGTSDYQDDRSKAAFTLLNLKDLISFSPNLTTIVGPRASGKTALVELLGLVFDEYTKKLSDGRPPLIQFLADKFPKLEVEVNYQYGEDSGRPKSRKVTKTQDPFYSVPMKIEYWTQGQVEEVASNKEQIVAYTKSRLQTPELEKITGEINDLKINMQSLRERYSQKFDLEVEKAKLEKEKEQEENYFKKLKTDEYRELVKKIGANRGKLQILDSFAQVLGTAEIKLEEAWKEIKPLELPDKHEVLKLLKEVRLSSKVDAVYKLLESGLEETVSEIIDLRTKIVKSKGRAELIAESDRLRKRFQDYCHKNGIVVTREMYESHTRKLELLNKELRELGSNIKALEAVKKEHQKVVSKLRNRLKVWKKENEGILRKFNNTYSESGIKAVWEDPKEFLAQWLKGQFLASNESLKGIVAKHFGVPSPVKENNVEEIAGEIVEKYGDGTLGKTSRYLRDSKEPPLEATGGKRETLSWFFTKKETGILREDLLMCLGEYGETGANLIEYRGKILGKDSMSFGERCGTLVELILYSGDHPLIIDQPEDHLDNKLLTESIVPLIRQRKLQRQVIICTHNPNIVVLGDSELVTVLLLGEEGTSVHQGSLENIETREKIYDVLEGGEEAFRKREQKYGLRSPT